MNRKILVLLVLIGLFAVIAVGGYALVAGVFETESEVDSEVSDVDSEVSDVNSEVSSEVSETKSEEIVKNPSEGVDTEVPETTEATEVEGDPEAEFDDNGVPREESTYLDDDHDTIANFYDICPGVDDFSDECETDAYNNDETEDVESVEAESVETEYDNNGDLRENSKYLDDDGDTIANFYDICSGVDDFSNDCDTDAYN